MTNKLNISRFRGTTSPTTTEKEIRGTSVNSEDNNHKAEKTLVTETIIEISEPTVNTNEALEQQPSEPNVTLSNTELQEVIIAKTQAVLEKNKKKDKSKTDTEIKRKHQYLVKDTINDKVKIQAIKEKKELHEKLEEYLIKGLKGDGVSFD